MAQSMAQSTQTSATEDTVGPLIKISRTPMLKKTSRGRTRRAFILEADTQSELAQLRKENEALRRKEFKLKRELRVAIVCGREDSTKAAEAAALAERKRAREYDELMRRHLEVLAVCMQAESKCDKLERQAAMVFGCSQEDVQLYNLCAHQSM